MKVKLSNAPVGLFDYDGTICLKTEYGKVVTDEKGSFVAPNTYIVDTGECFWGGAKTSRERNDLLVTPLYIKGRKLKKLRKSKDLGGKYGLQ